MSRTVIIAESYFDGRVHHDAGPYRIEIMNGAIRRIDRGAASSTDPSALEAPFVMPGLVEGHCHLFLDGNELDVRVRKEYLSAPLEAMMKVGRRNLEESLAAGVTLVRDAGDFYGINTRLRAEQNSSPGAAPKVRCPGRALRKAGRYGSFMAIEVTDAQSIVRAIHELALSADELKVLLTGIIDFETGQMKGGVQFDLAETRLIVKTARELNLRTYAHCSGAEGLKIAVEAGIDSIEHGFFMERDILKQMADQGIAWVPTFSPVYFQFERPELAGWKPPTVEKLGEIVRHHFEHVAMASDLGVPIVAGSDAGSYGVPHGKGLVDELFFQRRAGMPMDKVLASATSTPRRLWRCASSDLIEGSAADMVALDGSPFSDINHLRHVRFVVHGGSVTPATFVAGERTGT